MTLKQLLPLFVLLFAATSSVSAQNAKKLTVTEKVKVSGDLAREPMVAEAPNGDLYVTGYRNGSTSPQLWKSTDSGKTWQMLDVGTVADGADGNSDVDLVVDDTGKVYFLTMKFTKVPEDTSNFDWSSMKGIHIALGQSDNGGEDWKWDFISQNDFDDRPWVTLASDKSVHIVWNDGNGVHYRVSEDNGASWQERPKIHDLGGSSHFTAGPNGLLAARVSPMSASGNRFDAEVDLIKVSKDFGKTWNSVPLPGTREWSPELGKGLPRWVEPLAFSEKGELFHVWSEGQVLKMGVWDETQSDWAITTVSTSEQSIYYPFMSMGEDGPLITWVSGMNETLKHHAAVLTQKDGTWHVHEMTPTALPEITSRFGMGDAMAVGGEYFPLIQLQNGDFAMITTVQDNKNQDYGFTWWRLALQ